MIFKISIIIKLIYIVESYFNGNYEEKRVQKFFYNSTNSIWECMYWHANLQTMATIYSGELY